MTSLLIDRPRDGVALLTLNRPEVVVIGLTSAEWGEEVVAIVHGDGSASVDDLAGGARALLGSYKAPKRIRLSPAPLPRTTSGKIERRVLVELFHSLAVPEFQNG